MDFLGIALTIPLSLIKEYNLSDRRKNLQYFINYSKMEELIMSIELSMLVPHAPSLCHEDQVPDFQKT